MNCPARPPLLYPDDAAAVSRALADNRRGYTPEWRAPRGSDDAGLVIHEIFARYLEIQGAGVNAAPLRLQLEFLSMLGGNVLAAQPARVPLVFRLLSTATSDATVPQGTRVAAVLPPPAPSLASEGPPVRSPPPEFSTEQEFTAMRGTLAALYSIDPGADIHADHLASGGSGLAVFDRMQPVPHRLYLGHATLFQLAGTAQIILSFDFASPRATDAIHAQRPLLLDWEYLSVDGWQPLTVVEDTTQRFTQDGKVVLAKFHGPDSKPDRIAGRDSCWIRGTVSDRVPGARIASAAAGYLVEYVPVTPPVPVQPGQQVIAQGGSASSTVLAAGEGRLVLASPLLGAAPGNKLRRGGTELGILKSSPHDWRLPVESARDLLPGDVVTVDGTQRVRVVLTDETALFLQQPLEDAQPGLTVELADALPPLRPEGADAAGALPQVDVVRVRVGFGKSDLPLDSAYVDTAAADISKEFFLFGEQPARFASFYAACKDAFSRDGARVEVAFTFNQAGTGSAQVQAEFFNGTRWQALG
ncbi:MAG: putative rane protein, partial [Ramlibacter sp.]|nr:putative rane protein [Ramlibacter sp.]